MIYTKRDMRIRERRNKNNKVKRRAVKGITSFITLSLIATLLSFSFLNVVSLPFESFEPISVFAEEEASGYYDENGDWIDTSGESEWTEEESEPSGYYDENGEWVDTSGESEWSEEEEYSEETNGYYNEDGEWIVVEGEDEYSGEYVEDYSWEAAVQEEAEWQQEYWPVEETVPEETGENPEEKEPVEILPIVAPDGSIRKPVLSSGSAAVYCRNTGEMVFAKNANKRFSPYSITKLLTALLAVQRLPLDQKVTISEEAASQDGTTMNLVPGEVVTVEQLLYGTMILSGNDAAYALAETVSGNVDEFVKLMNDTVKGLGCKNTQFINPNGLIDDTSKQYTTAKDFVEISKMAFLDEKLIKIAGANEYNMPATNFHDAYKMEGHNELLLEGKDGYMAGKTGYWDDDKATIAMSYVDGNLELIVVALGGELDRRGSDCDQLIEYAVAKVEGLKVVEPGQTVASVKVKRGAVTRVEAVTDGESFIYLPKQASKELIQLVAVLSEDITAPVKAGDLVGTYEVYLADEMIDQVPLIAAADVEEGWILSYFGISNRNTIIIGLVLLGILALIILRALNIARLKRKQKREHQAKVRELAAEELKLEKEEFESYRGRFYK